MPRRPRARGVLAALVAVALGVAGTGCAVTCDALGAGCGSTAPDRAVDVVLDPSGSQHEPELRQAQLAQLLRVLQRATVSGRTVVNLFALDQRQASTRLISRGVILTADTSSPQSTTTLANAIAGLNHAAAAAFVKRPRQSDIWGAITFAAEIHHQQFPSIPYEIVVLGDGVQAVLDSAQPNANWYKRVPEPQVAAQAIVTLYPSPSLAGATVTIATGRATDRRRRSLDYIARLKAAHTAVCSAYGAVCNTPTEVN